MRSTCVLVCLLLSACDGDEANVAPSDAGVVDAQARVPTCDEVRALFRAQSEKLASDRGACADDRDCTPVHADYACAGDAVLRVCTLSVALGHRSDFEIAAGAAADVLCAETPDDCSSDPCPVAVAACVAGRCVAMAP